MKLFYLRGLNGIRAIAATAVLAGHTLNMTGLNNVHSAMAYGVTVFFCLSGFLITLLLLKEKSATNKISLTKFYLRRILRIWPLYFFYIFLSLGIIYLTTHEVYPFDKLKFYLFFVANYTAAFGNSINILFHYWSLGVEEQFYLFWPLLIIIFYNSFIRFVILFIIGFFILKGIINYNFGGYSGEYTFLNASRFGCMAIGAMGAWLYYTNNKILGLLRNRMIELVSWVLIVLTWFNLFHIISLIDHEIIAMATLVLIVNQVSGSSIVNLDQTAFKYLGKISFGIYVYHPLLILLFSYLISVTTFQKHPNLFAAISVCGVFFTTVIVSHFSYKYIETPFLNLKTRFAVIKNSADAG